MNHNSRLPDEKDKEHPDIVEINVRLHEDLINLKVLQKPKKQLKNDENCDEIARNEKKEAADEKWVSNLLIMTLKVWIALVSFLNDATIFWKERF